jgi:hypothetical protein
MKFDAKVILYFRTHKALQLFLRIIHSGWPQQILPHNYGKFVSKQKVSVSARVVVDEDPPFSLFSKFSY